MRRLLLILMALALSTPVAAQVALPERSSAIDRAALEAFVDGVVESSLERDHVPGLAVAIVQDGEVVLLKGYGHATLEPRRKVDPAGTLFRIGSIGKTMTWILLMQEAEAGRLSLDDPVNRHLPAKLSLPDRGLGRPVRIRDLMAHAGGFEDRAFGALFTDREDRLLPMEDWLAAYPPRQVRAPGVTSSYSNWATALAGVIATRSAGARDYPTLLEERIFRPLGMGATGREPYAARTGLPDPMPAELAGRRAGDYRWAGVDFVRQAPEFITPIMPAGGMYATVADMGLYMRAILGGGTLGDARIFGEPTARLLQMPILPAPPGSNGWNHGFVSTLTPAGVPILWHNGATLAATSNMLLVPSQEFGIFVVGNSPGSGGLTGALPALVIDRFLAGRPRPDALQPTPGVKADPAIAGTYLHTRRRMSGLEGFIGLVTSQSQVVLKDNGVVGIAGADHLPTSDPAIFRARDQSGHSWFRFDQDGRAIAFVPDSQSVTFERAAWWQQLDLMILLGGLTLAISVVVLLRLAFLGAGPSQSAAGGRSAWLAVGTSVGWIGSAALFVLWGLQADDPTKVAFNFPGPLLATASSLALLTAIGTVVLVALLLPLLRTERGWSPTRRFAHAAGAAVMLAYAALLLAWGALVPFG